MFPVVFKPPLRSLLGARGNETPSGVSCLYIDSVAKFRYALPDTQPGAIVSKQAVFVTTTIFDSIR